MDIRPMIILALASLVASAAATSEARPASQEGFRRAAFWMMELDASDAEIRARADALARSGIDGVILGGGGHHYLHNDLPNLEKYAAKAKQIVDACHARGIKVAEHHSVVLTTWKEYAMEHADWLQRDFEIGEPSVWPEYQTYAFCPNNLDFREHYWKIAKDLVHRTGMDALMSDDTVFHHGCCCRACSKRWREEVGGDVREAYRNSRKQGTREWRRFNEVRRRWYADFRAWLRERQKKELPKTLCISLVGSILCAWGTQTHGGSVEGGLDTSDVAIWEVYNPADFYSWRRLCAEAAALAEAARVRGCMPVCFPYADTVQKRDQFDPEEEVFMWALAQAHGMPFGLGRVFLNGPTENDPPRGYFIFERDRLKPYLGSEPAASIGILFSRCSRDNDPAWESLHSAPAIAWAEVLLDACIPWQAVTEETLDRGLPRQIRTLVLANVFALSERHLRVIEGFVSKGGVLIASYLPGVCDETGQPVLEARRSRLAKLLGVRIKSAELNTPGATQPRADFEPTTAAVFRDFEEERADSTASPSKSRNMLDHGVYVNRVGSGSVYYIPSLIERSVFLDWINEGMIYKDQRDKALAHALAKLVADVTPEQPVSIVRRDPSAHVLTTVRRLEGRLLIYVVNSAGADVPDETVIPLPSKVVWALPLNLTLSFSKAPRSVRIISLDSEDQKSIPRPGNRVTLRSPRRFGVIVAEF